MVRGKIIGGLSQEAKDEFKIRQIQGQWRNYDDLLKRMIILYDEFNQTYEKSIQSK